MTGPGRHSTMPRPHGQPYFMVSRPLLRPEGTKGHSRGRASHRAMPPEQSPQRQSPDRGERNVGFPNSSRPAGAPESWREPVPGAALADSLAPGYVLAVLRTWRTGAGHERMPASGTRIFQNVSSQVVQFALSRRPGELLHAGYAGDRFRVQQVARPTTRCTRHNSPKRWEHRRLVVRPGGVRPRGRSRLAAGLCLHP